MNSRLVAFVVMMLVCAGTVFADTIRAMPSQLLAQSHLIAIVSPKVTAESGKEVACTVEHAMKGDKPAGSFTMRFPRTGPAEGGLPITPTKGAHYLAFLRKNAVGLYTSPFGGQGVFEVGKEQVTPVVQMIGQYLLYAKLTPAARTKLLETTLASPDPMRGFGLDWLLCEEKPMLADPKLFTDSEIINVVKMADSDDSNVKLRALTIVGSLAKTRTDLVAYLVDAARATDRFDTRHFAIQWLDGRNHGPGPELDTTKSSDEQAQVLIEWWDKTASIDPKYKRYELPKDDKEHPEAVTPTRQPANKP